MIDVTVVGQRLNQLRELRGSSLSGLAAEAGVSKSYLAKLERGEIDSPGLQTLDAIATVLKITLNDLLAPAEPEKSQAATPSGSEVAEYQQLLASLPSGLKAFLDEKESQGERLPADAVRSLASIQMRGKRPKTARDWQFLYDAIRRSM